MTPGQPRRPLHVGRCSCCSIACNGSKPAAPAPAAKKDAGSVIEHREVPLTIEHLPEPVVALPRLDSFTVLDEGKGVKHALRYQAPAGSETYKAVTKLGSRRLAKGTWSAVTEMPPITDGFTVSGAGPSKPLVVRALKAETAKPMPEAEAYLSTWRGIEGRIIQLELDPRGQIGAIAFADDPTGARSAAARDELVQRLLLTVVPLPDKPVGVGAKWQVVTVLRQRPAVVKQTATYTLKELGDKVWKIDAKILRVAEEQVVSDPALPAGALADIVALVRDVHGTLAVSPARVFPQGTLDVSSTLHVRLGVAQRDLQEQILEDTGTVTLE